MIGIITKDYFFQFMKAAHEILWGFSWPKNGDDEQTLCDLFTNYILLMAGMDEDLAEYFEDYLNNHKELNIDQLDMLYDYLAGNETNAN